MLPSQKLLGADMSDNIDYNFIAELEKFKTKGYVPSDNSGVTIGTGVDLKSKNEDYFSELPKSIRDKLKPYFGLSGKAAKDKLAKIPLELDKNEAGQVNKIAKKNEANLLKRQWKKATGTDFDNLPSSLATPIASVAFQYGAGNPTDPKEGYPNFWAAATSGDVEGMEAELRAFSDKYPTRREAEADYMAGEQLSERVRRIRPELLPFLEKTQVGMVPMSAPETAYAEPVPRPQLASDIVEAAAVPAESGGISDLVSQVGSSLGFDRGSPRSTLAPSGLSEQEDARFNLLLQNLTGK
jgi:hypothetical protein